MKNRHKRIENQWDRYEYHQYSYTPENRESDEVFEDSLPQNAYSAAHFDTDFSAMQAVMHADNRKANHLFKTCLYLLIVLSMLCVIVIPTMFRLKHVYVEGNLTVGKQEIVFAAGLVEGLNMFQVNVSEMTKNIEKNHMLQVSSILLDYQNCSVSICVTERIPVAYMKQHGMQYVLDITGMVLAEENQYVMHPDLPVVTGFSNTKSCIVGQVVPTKDIAQLIAYQSMITELVLQLYTKDISEMNVSNPLALYLVTTSGDTVRLADSSYMRAKIGAVRTCMPYIKEQGMNCVLDVSIPEESKYLPM